MGGGRGDLGGRVGRIGVWLALVDPCGRTARLCPYQAVPTPVLRVTG